MTKPFLKQVADHIFEQYKDTVEKLCIVLPNKRGALFLKNHLAQSFGKTIWLPTIISAEDLVAELSGLKTLEEIDLLCHLYESYRLCYGPNAEPFDSFAKWGQLILQDFNELDRYLADSEQLYENLKDIKVIENWSLGEEKLSDYQQAYLQFMNSLGAIYKHYSSFLIANGWTYQGLAYRQAVAKLKNSEFANGYHKLLFCGFNALNAAELKIIDWYHSQKKAELLWDADTYYLADEEQEAGLFLRNNFALFKEKDAKFIGDYFKEPKSIDIISVPKQTGQAQVVKQELERLLSENIPADKIAVVLANEKLLWPVLQQLPPAVDAVNITMEYPLKYSATYSLIDLVLQIQLAFKKQTKTVKTLYHKDLVGLLRQPLFQSYLLAKGLDVNPHKIIQEISLKNLSFISGKTLRQLFENGYESVGAFLQPVENVTALNALILELLQTLIAHFSANAHSSQSHLELEYLQVILRNFNRLGDVLTRYPYFHDLQSYKQLFAQVVGNSSAPFIGEPLSGLQIMGVLETRTLDFDYLILVNANEGILPSGKSINSFIPNDLKRAFGLPLYLEKDAIYAYHFYRLLQRSKNITITFDSETDSFGKGEKSRFVTQLELEIKKYNPEIIIRNSIATYKVLPAVTPNAIRFQKTEAVLKPILQKACDAGPKGALSPSGLITYKECGLKFYFRYSAHLKEAEEVEESAEANTFGSILHLSLENLYKELIDKILDSEKLKQQLSLVDAVVNQSFISFFNNENPAGKNLLQEEVIKVYVNKLVNNDIRLTEKLKEENNYLTLNKLEEEFSAPLQLSIKGQALSIYIRGKIDRIDSAGGQTRIIDYKSSVKETDRFGFSGFENLFTDKNYNKQFQLLMYAWLLHKNNFAEPEQLVPCIIPFKVFSEEPKYILGEDKKPLKFTSALLLNFEEELSKFISGIFASENYFEQTDDLKTCEYCAYNTICNKVL
ncbi:MAG: PD-(D/E)XK nuclease family protein [Bacteroidia bacterium]|nr:PD-(D/E)XK nuclease family protein [Bacteroidia bacterium]